MMASLSALHVTPAAKCREAHNALLTVELFLSIALGTCSPVETLHFKYVTSSSPSSSSFILPLLPLFLLSFLSPSWHFFLSLPSSRHPVCFSVSPPLSFLPLLRLSPGSAGGVSEQPRHRPVWGEQGGGDRSLPQHQEGSLSWDLQPAGVRAPSGGWGDLLQH